MKARTLLQNQTLFSRVFNYYHGLSYEIILAPLIMGFLLAELLD